MSAQGIDMGLLPARRLRHIRQSEVTQCGLAAWDGALGMAMIDTVEVELDTPVELNDAELDAVSGGTGTLSLS